MRREGRVGLMRIEFEVYGVPVPKGSMKAFMRAGMTYPVITHDNVKTKPWASAVTTIAQQHRPPYPSAGAIALTLRFSMPKPKGLPKRTPSFMTKRPDLDKLIRVIGDCLRGVFYVDDAQIVKLDAEKTYANIPSVTITVESCS